MPRKNELSCIDSAQQYLLTIEDNGDYNTISIHRAKLAALNNRTASVGGEQNAIEDVEGTTDNERQAPECEVGESGRCDTDDRY